MSTVCWRDREKEVSSIFLLSSLFMYLPPPPSDLSRVADLQQVILSTFSSQSEEVRSAASYALGGWVGWKGVA